MGVAEYHYKLMWLRPTHVAITVPWPWVRALGLRQGKATWVKVTVRHDGSLVVVFDVKKEAESDGGTGSPVTPQTGTPAPLLPKKVSDPVK